MVSTVEPSEGPRLRSGVQDFRRAARIIALKGTEHRPWMASLHPARKDQIEYWEISDLDGATPEEALAAIETHVMALLGQLEK